MKHKLKIKEDGFYRLTLDEDDITLINMLLQHCRLGQEAVYSHSTFNMLRAIEKCEEKYMVNLTDNESYLRIIVNDSLSGTGGKHQILDSNKDDLTIEFIADPS